MPRRSERSDFFLMKRSINNHLLNLKYKVVEMRESQAEARF